MADKSDKSKDLIAIHKKIVAETQRIINDSKKLVSLLKGDIERQEKLLAEQQKALDKLLDDLHFDKD